MNDGTILKILCKYINSSPSFINGTFMKCLLWFVSVSINGRIYNSVSFLFMPK